MLKKILGVMLSVMVIGGFVNNTNTIISMEKKQCLEVVSLGTGDIDPPLFVIESNQQG